MNQLDFSAQTHSINERLETRVTCVKTHLVEGGKWPYRELYHALSPLLLLLSKWRRENKSSLQGFSMAPS